MDYKPANPNVSQNILSAYDELSDVGAVDRLAAVFLREFEVKFGKTFGLGIGGAREIVMRLEALKAEYEDKETNGTVGGIYRGKI